MKFRIKNVYSASFLGSSNAPQPRPPNRFSRKIRQTTWFSARFFASRLIHCWAFSGLGNKKLTFRPSYSRNHHFWARFWRNLENFRPKTSLQWGMLHVNFWTNRAIRFKFGRNIEPDPFCVWIIKRTLSGRGRGHVTQFRNFATPYNFRTNQVICFKFGTDIEDGPLLRMDHKTTNKWAWPGSCNPISKFRYPL